MIQLIIDQNNPEHLQAITELENRALAKKVTHHAGCKEVSIVYEEKTYTGSVGLKEFLGFIEPYKAWDASICDNWDGVNMKT